MKNPVSKVNMNNRFFDDKMLDVLLMPDCWRVVSSWFTPENDPICELTSCDISLHKHAHKEILFVVSGQGEYSMSGQVYPCTSGNVFLIDSFKEHQITYPELFIDADHLWVFVFEDYVMFRLIHICRGSAAVAGLWTQIIHAAKSGAASNNCIFGDCPDSDLPNEYRRYETYSGLISLVSAIVKEGYTLPPKEDHTSFQKRVIATIRNHIYETSGKGASLETLAMMSGYSKFHFLRLFKAHTGTSLRHYIDYCRLEKVAEMQKNGFYKKEIASTLGFSSLSAFSRWYKGAQQFK